MNDDIKQPNSNNNGVSSEVPVTETETTVIETTDTTTPVDTQDVAPSELEEKPKSSGGSKVAVWIVLVVLALLVGGGLGYIFGTNSDTVTPEQQAQQAQIDKLEADLEAAQKNAATGAATEKDSQIATLEAENATLTTQNADLTAENKELQATIDELEAAESSNTTPTN